MAENNVGQNVGPKRLVVGAHYGMRDWLAQRITAVLMVVYTLILLVKFLTAGSMSYENWVAVFSEQWFKLATFVVVIALLYHAWVGVRDIWMDYIKPVALRLFLQVATIIWLVACAGWAFQILWRV